LRNALPSLALILSAALFSFPANADTPATEQQTPPAMDEKTQEAMVKLMDVPHDLRTRVYSEAAEEADDCLAYYEMEAVCFGAYDSSPPPDFDKADAQKLYKQLDQIQKSLYLLARTLTLGAEIKQETILARTKISFDADKEVIDKNCGNFSLLLEQKSAVCKEMTEQPVKRLAYWLERNQSR
jgi:hypothetical protein